MSRRLLLTVALVCGFAILGSAVTISGFFDQELDFDFGAGFNEFWFDTEIGLEAGFGAWNIGTFIDLETDGWEDLEFFTLGSVGAFNVYSIFEFHAIDGGALTPGDNIKQDWDTAIWTRLAGVDLWAIFSILGGDDPVDGWISGAGWAWGLHGQAGDFEVWTEMRFNLRQFVRWVVWNDFDTAIRFNQGCDTISVEEPHCDLDFTYANIYARFPVDCMDVGARIGLHDTGFSNLRFWVEDIETPIKWLEIDTIHLWFYEDEKDLALMLDFSVAEVSCITPYISLAQNATMNTVDGVQLDALGLEVELENVAVIASAMFDDTEYYLGEDARIHTVKGNEPYAYTLYADCIGDRGGMEFAFGFEVGGAGCCAPQTLGVYGFFGPFTPTALFDLETLRVIYEDHITPQLSWLAEFTFEASSAPRVEFAFAYEWGDVQITNSMESCCRIWP